MLAIWTAIIFGKRWRCCSKTLRKTLMKWQPKCKSFRLWIFSKRWFDSGFCWGNSLLFKTFKSAWKKCPTEHWEIGKILLFHFFLFMPFQIILRRIFGWGKNLCFFSKSNLGGIAEKNFKNYGHGKYFRVYPYFRYSDINMKGFFFSKTLRFFSFVLFSLFWWWSIAFFMREKKTWGGEYFVSF